MNWRLIIGLIFLILGVRVLYTVMSPAVGTKLSISPALAEVGCMIWILTGILLIIKAFSKKQPDEL
jgi:hypothetical protein